MTWKDVLKELSFLSLKKRRLRKILLAVSSYVIGAGRQRGFRLFSKIHSDRMRQQTQVVKVKKWLRYQEKNHRQDSAIWNRLLNEM